MFATGFDSKFVSVISGKRFSRVVWLALSLLIVLGAYSLVAYSAEEDGDDILENSVVSGLAAGASHHEFKTAKRTKASASNSLALAKEEEKKAWNRALAPYREAASQQDVHELTQLFDNLEPLESTRRNLVEGVQVAQYGAVVPNYGAEAGRVIVSPSVNLRDHIHDMIHKGIPSPYRTIYLPQGFDLTGLDPLPKNVVPFSPELVQEIEKAKETIAKLDAQIATIYERRYQMRNSNAGLRLSQSRELLSKNSKEKGVHTQNLTAEEVSRLKEAQASIEKIQQEGVRSYKGLMRNYRIHAGKSAFLGISALVLTPWAVYEKWKRAGSDPESSPLLQSSANSSKQPTAAPAR